MTHFATLYKLAHCILTAPRESELGKLSRHSGQSDAKAHEILRGAILQATMPGENCNTPWAVVRVFMRNLVNRAFAPISGTAMLDVLATVENDVDGAQFERRIELLNERVTQRSLTLADSLSVMMNVEPVAGQSYIAWLMQKADYYANLPIAQLSPAQVVEDVRTISTDSRTKIPNIGIALAANLLADLGASALAKPDKHVLLTVMALMAADELPNADSCIRKVIEVAKQEAPLLNLEPEYRWLGNGLRPRHFDRLIYLIGSDNFCLNGIQNKRKAPIRRQLMCDALRRGGEIDELINNVRIPPRPPLAGAVEHHLADLGNVGGNAAQLDNIDAEIVFYDALGEAEDALRFVEAIEDLAVNEGCEVHYTFKDNADFRIRAFRNGLAPAKQNVVVMSWRPQKHGFACQLLASVDSCRELGLLAAMPQPRTSSPLPSKVFLDPRDVAQVSAFLSAVVRSILKFTE